jgi:hypothetical protein
LSPVNFLTRLPKLYLDDYYREQILPVKYQIDVDYMSRATLIADFKLLIDTALRRWDPGVMESLLSGSNPRRDNNERAASLSRSPSQSTGALD